MGSLHTPVSRHQQRLRNGIPFYRIVISTLESLEGEEWKEVLAELYEHPSIYRFLAPLEDEDKNDLIEETKHLLKSGR